MRKLWVCLFLGAVSTVSLSAGGPPSQEKIDKQEQKYAKQRDKLYEKDRKAAEKMARESVKYHARKDKQQKPSTPDHNPK